MFETIKKIICRPKTEPIPDEILPPREPVKFNIIQGDITDVSCDAIINASNSRLSPGGGVDYRINEVAGPMLREASIAKAPCTTGNVAVTPGFNLPASFVIHTVAPIWGYDSEDLTSYRRDVELLQNCYENILFAADKLQIKSIAIPAIGTGAHSIPIEVSASVAHAELNRYRQRQNIDIASGGNKHTLEEVTFVLHSNDNFDCYAAEFESDVGASIEAWEQRIDGVGTKHIYTDSSEIILKGNFYIHLVPSSLNKIIVTGINCYLDNFVHRPRGDQHIIEANSEKFLNVIISSNFVQRVVFEGAGIFEFETPLKQDFELTLFGNNNAKFIGIIENLTLNCQGEGGIDALALQTKSLVIKQDGSHEIHAKASDAIRIEKTGYGDIYISGNPADREIVDEGIGKLIFV